MGKFRQTTSELWPLIDVKNCILFVSALLLSRVVFDRFSSNFAYELIPARSGLGL